MTSFSLRGAGLAFSLLASVAAAAELPILTRARARLAPDATLDGVKSLHFTGRATSVDKDGKTMTGRIEMFFQKPDRQQIVVTWEKGTDRPFAETTTLDAYEGWSRVQDTADPSKWRFTLLDGERVKDMRASTWQSLYYFRGIESVGGRVEEQGTMIRDGVTCQKVAFIHSPKIIFYRFFDTTTGRLVVTETDSGASIHESGELLVNGIRFAKEIVTTQRVGDKANTLTVTYDKITVNENLPATQFAMPSFRNQ